jgi:hypothetical protein
MAGDESPVGSALVGSPLRKRFGKRLYGGTVSGFDAKARYYKVTYEDGDAEELELAELRPLLTQPPRAAHSPAAACIAPAAAAAAPAAAAPGAGRVALKDGALSAAQKSALVPSVAAAPASTNAAQQSALVPSVAAAPAHQAAATAYERRCAGLKPRSLYRGTGSASYAHTLMRCAICNCLRARRWRLLTLHWRLHVRCRPQGANDDRASAAHANQPHREYKRTQRGAEDAALRTSAPH